MLLTPAHHSPFGMSLHPARRTAVVDWAQRTDGYVFDDDYDGEFRYDRQPIGALQPLCPDRVVYLGSASKSLSQALRLGWMVVPDNLIDAVMDAAGGQQFYVDAVTQLTMADFIGTGSYDKHIRRMRMRYRRRRDALYRGTVRIRCRHQRPVGRGEPRPDDADGTEHEVLRRAGEAGIALQGLAIMRHPLAGPGARPGRDHRRFRRARRSRVRRSRRCAFGRPECRRAGKVVRYEPAASPHVRLRARSRGLRTLGRRKLVPEADRTTDSTRRCCG